MKKAAPKHTNATQYTANVETSAVMGRVLVDQLDRLAKELSTLRKASVFQPRLAAIRAAAELMIGGKDELGALSALAPVRKKRRKRRKKQVATGE